MPDRVQLRTLGQTGLPMYNGVIYDDPLNILQGERGRKILREMSEQDPTIGGVLLAIEMLTRQVKWTTIPANQSAKAKEVADFIDECFTDMEPSWEDTLSEVLSMLVYGWSWLEILYKRRSGMTTDAKSSRFTDGKVGWRGWSIRGQETLYEWVFDETLSDIVSMKQMAPPTFKVFEIPRSKSLHFRTTSRLQNPEGKPILRNAYRPWYLKKNIEVIEGIGIERDLAGLPVMGAPARLFATELSADDSAIYEQLKTIVTNIRRDEQEGVLLPLSYDEAGNKEYELSLLSTGGQRQFDTDKIVNRYDVRIAMSMLADFMMLGQEAVGSFALSSDKTELFATALGTILDGIGAEITRNAIPKLVLLNGWPLELAPSRKHGDIESLDLGKLGVFLQNLSLAGMTIFPNEKLEKYLLEQAGLPAENVEQEDTGLHEAPPEPVLPQPGKQPGDPLQLPDGTQGRIRRVAASDVADFADPMAFWANNAVQGKKGFQPTGGDGGAGAGPANEAPAGGGGEIQEKDLSVRGERLTDAEREAAHLPYQGPPASKNAWSKPTAETEYRAVIHKPTKEVVGYLHPEYERIMNGSYQTGTRRAGTNAYWASATRIGFGSNDSGAKYSLVQHLNKPSMNEWAVLASEQFAEHTGAMVALMLPDAVAARLAFPGGEPSGDLHVTLAFLSADAANEQPETRDKWRMALDEFSRSDVTGIRGRISGAGKFNPQPSSDGAPVLYASVDAPGLSELRTSLVQTLAAYGISIPTDHGFTPHVTLMYGDGELPEVPTLDVSFDRVTLVVGDQRTEYHLRDG